MDFRMRCPFLLLPISCVNPNILTHRAADRELISHHVRLTEPYTLVHPIFLTIVVVVEIEQQNCGAGQRPSTKEYLSCARQHRPITPPVFFHSTIPRNACTSPSLAGSLPFPRKCLRY